MAKKAVNASDTGHRINNAQTIKGKPSAACMHGKHCHCAALSCNCYCHRVTK